MLFIAQGKTNWTFLLIVFILALMVGLGILKYYPKINDLGVEQNTETSQENNKNTVCNITDWATYTDNEFGFSMQYPKNVYSSDGLVPVKIIKEDAYKTWVAFDESNLWTTGISIIVEPAENENAVKDFIDRRFSGQCTLDYLEPISNNTSKIHLKAIQQEGPNSCGAWKLEYRNDIEKIVMIGNNGAPTFFVTKETSDPSKAVFCDQIILDSFQIFNIERYVKIIAPNGGENLCLGKDFSVKWRSKDVDAVSLTIMQYYIGGGGYGYGLGQFPADHARENPGEGQYIWKVGETTGNNKIGVGYGYKITIKGGYQGETVEDESDNTFNIISCE